MACSNEISPPASRGAARELAEALVMALDGVFILARSARSTESLQVAVETMTALVRDAIAKRPHRRRLCT